MSGKAWVPGVVAAVLAAHAAALTLLESHPPPHRAAVRPTLSVQLPMAGHGAGGDEAAQAQPQPQSQPNAAHGQALAATNSLALTSSLESSSVGPVQGGDGWSAYLPRPLLTQAPQARDSVLLEWPAFAGEQERYVGVLALYIDEQGQVQRVVVDDDGLPPELADVARRQFAGLSFVPGKLDGQSVKSLIHVEVSFEQVERVHSVARSLNP